MELVIVKRELGALEINYEELKKELEASLVKYEGLVVSEDKIVESKQVRANLNKLAKMIDDRRKELKKEILKPYEEVERQTKELVGMIDAVNSAIDSQIKVYEEKQREEKRSEVQLVWSMQNYEKVPLEKIFRDEWLNKTCTLKKIEEDMISIINQIEGGLKTIDSLIKDVEVAEIIKAKYLIRLDLNCVIAEYENEEAAKKRLAKETSIEVGAEAITDAEIVIEEPKVVAEEEKKFRFAFEAIGTEKQLDQLTAVLKQFKEKGLIIHILND